MKGLTEAIAEKEKQFCPRQELTEDRIAEINERITKLKVGERVTVSYYCQYSKQYKQIQGIVAKIDPYWKELQINEILIDFKEIQDLTAEYGI